MTELECDQIIRMAWEDRSTFEEIEEKTGFSEAAVITLMRRQMKPSSFKMWRKRVRGRITKHRKLLLEATACGYRGRVDPTDELTSASSRGVHR